MDHSRRKFIKNSIGAGLLVAGTGFLPSCSFQENQGKKYNSHGLPTAELGSTGVQIPRIVLGLGSRFCHIDSIDESTEMLHFALDNGFYYWDTAHIYDNTIALPSGKTQSPQHVISEERVGEVTRYRRNEIFLSTKVTDRDPSEAMRQIELSLKRLHTDKLDMLKIHDVHSMEDVNQMSKKGHLIDILSRLKEEGVTQFIGYSGHGNAECLKEMSQRANFDSMLIAMNHWGNGEEKREETAIPAGKAKKMGVLLMKAVRPKELIPGLHIPDLIRYALSLEGADAVVIGMDSKKVVQSNLDVLRSFKKMSPMELKEMAQRLEPFYRHENLPWMHPDYQDGLWG